jgi:hypothetical protein
MAKTGGTDGDRGHWWLKPFAWIKPTLRWLFMGPGRAIAGIPVVTLAFLGVGTAVGLQPPKVVLHRESSSQRAAGLSHRAVIAASPLVLLPKTARHGTWNVTVTGSGFRGDDEVRIYFPTHLVTYMEAQAQPTGGVVTGPGPGLCPPEYVKAPFTNGTFTTVLSIAAGLPDGKYRIYAKGTTSLKESFATIYIGGVPSPRPLPGSLTTASPAPRPRILCKRWSVKSRTAR